MPYSTAINSINEWTFIMKSDYMPGTAISQNTSQQLFLSINLLQNLEYDLC